MMIPNWLKGLSNSPLWCRPSTRSKASTPWCLPFRPPWKGTTTRSSLLTITALMERLTEFVKSRSAISGSVRIHRIGRRGLSGAFIEGALATAAPVVAVIDGDMQHDEMLLPAMLKTLRSRDLEVVVGSRYLEQGGVGTGRRVASVSRNGRLRSRGASPASP